MGLTIILIVERQLPNIF
uniref:Uncharacterized protein n=1 Tax=Rhizophora mucronata TaxID=61149 RepID=A0A2P2R1G4_RHIMU